MHAAYVTKRGVCGIRAYAFESSLIKPEVLLPESDIAMRNEKVRVALPGSALTADNREVGGLLSTTGPRALGD